MAYDVEMSTIGYINKLILTMGPIFVPITPKFFAYGIPPTFLLAEGTS